MKYRLGLVLCRCIGVVYRKVIIVKKWSDGEDVIEELYFVFFFLFCLRFWIIVFFVYDFML